MCIIASDCAQVFAKHNYYRDKCNASTHSQMVYVVVKPKNSMLTIQALSTTKIFLIRLISRSNHWYIYLEEKIVFNHQDLQMFRLKIMKLWVAVARHNNG